METLQAKPFNLTVEINGEIQLKRNNDKMNIRSGDCDKIVDLLLHAQSLEMMRMLPDKISSSPFEVQFTPDRVLTLARKEVRNAMVRFRFNEIDTLIELLKQGILKLRDMSTIVGGPKGHYAPPSTPDPVIEGRD